MLQRLKNIIIRNRRAVLLVSLLIFSNVLVAQTGVQENSGDSSLYVLGAIMVLLLILIIAIGSTISNLAGNKDFWKSKLEDKSSKSLKTVIFFLILTGVSISSQALSPESNMQSASEGNFIFWLLFVSDIILAIILFSMIRILQGMTKSLVGEEEVKEDIIDKISLGLTNAVPIEREEEVMMDHEYDGIRELDNVLPPWWIGMFYASIIFALVYIPYYHFGSGQLQTEEYLTEMADAEEKKAAFMAKMANAVNESNVKLLTDKGKIDAGKKIYKDNCVACHGMSGEGGVGPNLTDEYWVHGGGINNVFKTIKYGVPEKGMIAWETQLTPAQLNEVSSFILITFPETNPPNGKEPQGEVYKEGGENSEMIELDSTSDSSQKIDE